MVIRVYTVVVGANVIRPGDWEYNDGRGSLQDVAGSFGFHAEILFKSAILGSL